MNNYLTPIIFSITCAAFINSSHAGASENPGDLITKKYKGKENLKPWYDKLMEEINKLGKNVEVAPKKADISLRKKKQFAVFIHPFLRETCPIICTNVFLTLAVLSGRMQIRLLRSG